jgi:integrase
VAATTGLRRSELAQLAWADVDLENATVRVRPTTAKNRREAVLPLPGGTVAALSDLRDGAPEGALVFRPGVPRTSTLRKDLAAARIPVATPQGVVDLHSLRVTYGTMLARAGVSLAQAQKLMRHSTPALTANVYVKLQMDDAREAVARIDVRGLAS